MVMFYKQHLTAVDPIHNCCLPMTGEDTGLEALASPQAGYLGKVHQRAASLDSCPWCTKKGLTYSLRSYRINLQESITLCTNPQCLFPLVTYPLEDIFSRLDLTKTVDKKRKAPENEEFPIRSVKRQQTNKVDNVEPQALSEVEDDTPIVVRKEIHQTSINDNDTLNGRIDNSHVGERAGCMSQQEKNAQEKNSTEDSAFPLCLTSGDLSLDPMVTPNGDGMAPCPARYALRSRSKNNHTTDNCTSGDKFWSTEKSLAEETVTNEDVSCTKSKRKDTAPADVVPLPKQLFWSNRDNLCWLDSLLVALVCLKSLRKNTQEDTLQSSAVGQVISRYDDIYASVQMLQQIVDDGVAQVPSHALKRADADLHKLRMSIFRLLQPKLHCKLGQRETPVFAMPLLLSLDSWAEHLFQTTSHWEFRCRECKATLRERTMKTLITCTKLTSDWHPLRAVHNSPCNSCHTPDQMRTLVLEKVAPVFVLHFVEGLPSSNFDFYSFNFKGRFYSVTTVIQYNEQIKHFVTWVRNGDETWIEYDDLKHPRCKTHQKLLIPSHQIHIVFWEVETDAVSSICSSPGTLIESTSAENISCLNGSNLEVDEPSIETQNQSVFIPHNDTDIVCALSEDVGNNASNSSNAADAETSIGATTLLNAFEGLNHNDIITLTLVDVQTDATSQPLNDNKEIQDFSVSSRSDKLIPSPDNSILAESHGAHLPGDIATTSSSSDPEMEDSRLSDSAFGPVTRSRVRKGRTLRQEASAKPSKEVSTSSENGDEFSNTSERPVVKENNLAVADDQQPSPVSSSVPIPMSSNTETQSAFVSNAHWSFLVSRHPLSKVQKTTHKLEVAQNITSPPKMKAVQPIQSTPNLVKKLPIPIGLSKPQLIAEGSEGFPPKAAEMYIGFGAKTSHNQKPHSSFALASQSEQLQHTSPSNPPKPLPTSMKPPLSTTKLYTDLCSSKKPSSKVPLGLCDTDTLRHKLLKKLKAKKKKLAKLNLKLSNENASRLLPDSTALTSPSTVSSSTYDTSTCDDFLSDLLSPATTASNLSPDSTDFLEMLASGQNVPNRLDPVINYNDSVSQPDIDANNQNPENFLEDFLSQCCDFGTT